MTEANERIERYLEELAAGIEALGPEESAEVAAEVRAHLAEAVADAHGDEEAVLAHFGSADALAARILEERAVVVGGGALPAAPAGRQALALLLDVFLWVAGVLGLYLALLLIGFQALGVLEPTTTLLQLLNAGIPGLSLAFAAWLGWWLLRARRIPGSDSPGMRLLGLRRIRLAKDTRVVRLRQVPGMKRPSPLVPSIVVAAGLVVVVAFGWMGVRSSQVRGEGAVVTAVEESAGAVRTVTGLYQRVTRGMDATATQDTYLPSAEAAIAALDTRRAKGALASYSVEMTGFTDATPRIGLPAPGQTLGARVTVNEYGAISEKLHTTWDYDLVYGEVTNADGSSGWGWRITSVVPSNVEYQ